MAVLDRVMAGLDADAVARLAGALETERSVSREEFLVVGHDLHNVLAEVSGNRVLELLTLVLTRLTLLHSAAPDHSPDLLPTGDALEVHQRIVDAIVGGDREVARRRMQRHLDALVPWVR